MQIIRDKASLSNFIRQKKREGLTLGFVPTMGALHEGHISLIRASQKAGDDLTICSIFVNPTQFNNPEDFAKYPNKEKEDIELLSKVGCHLLFMPSVNEMYPENNGKNSLKMNFGMLEASMEGAFRPGHFNGVALIVSKLFHLVQPDRAYFGQKDLQQCRIVQKLVNDLLFPIEIVICPILRESDGLAMSSRNLRLTPHERKIASKIYEALLLTRKKLKEGFSVQESQNEGINFLRQYSDFKLEYLELVHWHTLETVDREKLLSEGVICIAVHLGNVRLIDNLLINESGI
ncbi:MAG: pantoate--beta-alanine ligase [Flammeovirgaceae bacterium]